VRFNFNNIAFVDFRALVFPPAIDRPQLWRAGWWRKIEIATKAQNHQPACRSYRVDTSFSFCLANSHP